MRTFLSFFFILFASIHSNELDDYVKKFDPNYSYDIITSWRYDGDGFTAYHINMTSQKWLTENDSSRSIWYHDMVIAIPHEIKNFTTAYMYIGLGGNNPNYVPKMDDKFNEFISMMALSTGSVAFVIRNVPNQSIIFNDDPLQMHRSEDEIIAFTWYKYIEMNGSKPEWLIRFPMTKAAVRAMDTVADFSGKIDYRLKLDKFFVCGESKRGWTTWTTAAVDKRVIGIAPIVMDELNFSKNLHHHYRSLGGWTFAFNPYWQLNITQYLDSPILEKMMDLIDPYSYRDRYSVPIYVISTSSDEFFLPDDSYYYWNNFTKYEKYTRVIANCEHELIGHRMSLFYSLHAFYKSILENEKRPKFSWNVHYSEDKKSGRIDVQCESIPDTITVYSALTEDDGRRDFRLLQQDPFGKPGEQILHPIIYHKKTLKVNNATSFSYNETAPTNGRFKAFFIQLTFPSEARDATYEFTTQAVILPNEFPFGGCYGYQCQGKLSKNDDNGGGDTFSKESNVLSSTTNVITEVRVKAIKEVESLDELTEEEQDPLPDVSTIHIDNLMEEMEVKEENLEHLIQTPSQIGEDVEEVVEEEKRTLSKKKRPLKRIRRLWKSIKTIKMINTFSKWLNERQTKKRFKNLDKLYNSPAYPMIYKRVKSANEGKARLKCSISQY
ncbi:hypothetical protein SNEBB_007603 [Seison nebaliae]|nr:hypothetical protein SNEBB_007603 [Seison nebaliae]